MKVNTAYLIFIIFMMIGAPLYAGTQTLTTYYPAPNGDYVKLKSSSLHLMPSTLNDIQKQFNCSYDPAAELAPCPAGIVYFDVNAQMVYISAGTHWSSVNATCVPVIACSGSLNCGTDSCGNYCGTCSGTKTCTGSSSSSPGSCV
jgi:hypothetical protein